ncbi:MAG TPA: membrane protein insertase YidC [Stellaceae bacterium]|nr:membrane protein insertase YidC [Stellaceae bacterium]
MEQRNLLLAIVLSVGILIAFQFLIGKFHPLTPPAPHAPAVTQGATKTPGATAPSGTAPAPSAAAGVPAAPATPTPQQVIAKQPRIPIDTPSLRGSIDLVGARLDNLTLAKYRQTTAPNSPDVVLLEPTGTKHAYFAQFGWVADHGAVKLPGPDSRWTAPAGARLTPATPLTLTWNNGEGLLFTRTLTVDKNYMFTVKQVVRNTTAKPVELSSYALINRTGTPHVLGYYILFEGMIGELHGSLQEVKYGSLKPGEPDVYDTTGGWLGFTDKYWLTALVLSPQEAAKSRFTHVVEHGVDRYQTDFTGPSLTVPAGGTAATSTRFFAGAKELSLLEGYQAQGIPRFDLAIDFGWFYFLTKPIFLVLEFFYGILGNFGLAILLLTLLIKLAFFPLANKSYQAMAKMRLLQPQMQKIREQFPDDKARQQQEIMGLYKKVGANPLAGCLPIVIQIPVFFALYKVLFVTIEMRQAPFYGWIHDLSAPDPTSFANLFGLIPWTPPHVLMIGAWPIIMGVTMFLQQKLNPQPVDPTQAKMFMVLPVVFTYMLSAFPAGLVIYWAWNNLLSVAQQWAIMHRVGAA